MKNPLKSAVLAVALAAGLAGPALAWDPDIHTLALGDQAIRLGQDRAVTPKEDGEIFGAAMSPDGNWVAYISRTDAVTKFCLVPAAGGKVSVLFTGVGTETDTGEDDKLDRIQMWDIDDGIDWSEDSKSVAIAAERMSWKSGKRTDQSFILVYSTSGSRLVSQPVPGRADVFELSATGKLVAVTSWVNVQEEDELAEYCHLTIFDTEKGTAKTISTSDHILSEVGWDNAGQSLLCSCLKKDQPGVVLKRKWLDGRPDEIVLGDYGDVVSPDRKLQAPFYNEGGGMVVEDLATTRQTKILDSGDYRAAGWTDDSRLLMLWETIPADSKHTEETDRLWLVKPEKGPNNALLLSEDYDCTVPVSWKADQTRFCCVSGGRVHVVDLEFQKQAAIEKAGTRAKENTKRP